MPPSLKLKIFVFCPHFTYVFCMDLRTNSECIPMQN